MPKTNAEFWLTKVAANRARDARKVRALRKLGLRVITVWQCETRDASRLEKRLAHSLGVSS